MWSLGMFSHLICFFKVTSDLNTVLQSSTWHRYGLSSEWLCIVKMLYFTTNGGSRISAGASTLIPNIPEKPHEVETNLVDTPAHPQPSIYDGYLWDHKYWNTLSLLRRLSVHVPSSGRWASAWWEIFCGKFHTDADNLWCESSCVSIIHLGLQILYLKCKKYKSEKI